MQGVFGRAVRVRRPKQLTGLPEAHSGRGFTTLVGVAMLAGGGTGDIALPTGQKRKPSTGWSAG